MNPDSGVQTTVLNHLQWPVVNTSPRMNAPVLTSHRHLRSSNGLFFSTCLSGPKAIFSKRFPQPTVWASCRFGGPIQLGYFRVVSRFFVVDRFEPADTAWLTRQLGFEPMAVTLADYAASQTVYRHRHVILDQLGYEAFSPAHRDALRSEAARLTHLQTRPARMLDELAIYLRERRVEVPPYNTLREILDLLHLTGDGF